MEKQYRNNNGFRSLIKKRQFEPLLVLRDQSFLALIEDLPRLNVKDGCFVVQVLGESGSPAAIETLIGLLHHKKSIIRGKYNGQI